MRHAMRLPAVLLCCLVAATAARAESLTVYSALEDDEIASYLAGAHKALPDLDIHVLRLSTGDLAARLLAEAGAPRNDIIWGEALTSVLDPRIQALLAPATGPAIAALPPMARDGAHRWSAPTGYVTAFCVNTEALKARGLPMPTSWADLTAPGFRGEVVMPDPVSSGVGYMQVSAILQAMGPAKGWQLLAKLAPNIAQYTPSGSNPCKLARTGEYAVGVSLDLVALQSVAAGYPVRMVIPSDNVGYELEANAVMRASAHAPAATRFVDWLASADAATYYRSIKTIVTVPGSTPDPDQLARGLPANLRERLAPVDFPAAARGRPGVVAGWKALTGY
jgi:iron(III) transport system substrate-binding protein